MTDKHEDLTANRVVRKLSTFQFANIYVRGILAGFPPGFPLDFSVYTRNSETDMTTQEGWKEEMLLNRNGGIIQIFSSQSKTRRTLKFDVTKQKLIKLYNAFKVSNADAVDSAPYRASAVVRKTS